MQQQSPGDTNAGNEQARLNSQFEIISDGGFTEYRYYTGNRRAHGPSGPGGLLGTLGPNAWAHSSFVALVAFLCYKSQGDSQRLLALTGVCLLYAYWRCTAVIYESILVLPPHGVQLETHRGPLHPLFVSRRFIPSMYVKDIIINEALHRWNVRYYLAVMVSRSVDKCELVVIFENTLPHFPILLEVYRGMKDALSRE